MAIHPKLDLVGIAVKDMAKALTFYRDLGLNIPPEMDSEGHVEYTLENGLRLAWDTHEVLLSFDPDWKPSSGGHGIGLAFLCDSPADVNSQFERLKANGHTVHKEPWDAFWGQRYAQFKDPDGNVIDLFASLD